MTAKTKQGQRTMLTTEELSDMFRVSTVSIRRWAREGAIPSFWVGGSLRFDSEAIEAWIQTGGTPSPNIQRRGNPQAYKNLQQWRETQRAVAAKATKSV